MLTWLAQNWGWLLAGMVLAGYFAFNLETADDCPLCASSAPRTASHGCPATGVELKSLRIV